MCYWQLTEDHALEMVYTRQKARADVNPGYLPINHHKINIREVQTISWTVFTQYQNELFVQQVVQDTQGLEDEVFHYHDICLNEYSIKDYMKNPLVNWLFNINLKNKHPQASSASRMINEATEGVEDILCHNDTMRRTQEREEDIQSQEEDWRFMYKR